MCLERPCRQTELVLDDAGGLRGSGAPVWLRRPAAAPQGELASTSIEPSEYMAPHPCVAEIQVRRDGERITHRQPRSASQNAFKRHRFGSQDVQRPEILL